MATEHIVDAHTHVACEGYAEAGRALSLNTSKWWEQGGDEPSLAATLEANGVEGAVVVQAVGLYGFDCTCAADTVAANPDRYALVVAVDMAADDPPATVAAMAATMPVAGVRMFGIIDGGAPWIVNGKGDAVFGALAELDLVAVPCIFGGDLPAFSLLASRHPGTTIALDHCGFPDLGPPESEDSLIAMAELANVNVKVSSHNLDQPGDPARLVDRLAEAYGTSRLCWGSDHPQHNSLTYPEMLQLAHHGARNVGQAGLAAFLGGNTRRLWWDD